MSVDTILSGQYDAPYANRAAWKSLQSECADLRRVHAHLSKGTKPADKRTNATAIKRYLNDVVIARDGVLVVIRSELYQPRRELIVVPKHLLSGLLTSIHLQLNHASAYQLQKVFSRNYFSQGVAKCVASVVGNCHTCQSLKVVPRELHSIYVCMYVCIVARSASKAHGGMLGENRPCNLFHYAGTLSPAVEGQHRGSLVPDNKHDRSSRRGTC